MHFTPAVGLKNPHLQTLAPRLIRRAALFEPFWQTLDTPDGDFLELAWSENWQTEQARTKPVFVLFHGLEGCFYSPYANGLLNAFARAGWLAVMMHFRGCGGKPNRLARSYHSGEVSDARFFLKYLQEQLPDQRKVAVGISLGGNMLVNYLARYREDPILDAATVVSAPLDLAACAQRIEQGFSKVYRTYLLSSMKRNALRKYPLLKKEISVTHQGIELLSTLYDFDDLITAPLHGFKNADDYYQQCSGIHYLNQVSVPLQVIHARDDPFMTKAVIPDFALPKHINYQLYDHGGHVGFLSGSTLKPQFWLEATLPVYYENIGNRI
ncbi:hydrolase [Endozoicomonas atrinae]|uniref:hydrolase n=1 Tax=Endozoicomonas atrinae TaxID=1333660 RepID=UPI003B007F08